MAPIIGYDGKPNEYARRVSRLTAYSGVTYTDLSYNVFRKNLSSVRVSSATVRRQNRRLRRFPCVYRRVRPGARRSWTLKRVFFPVSVLVIATTDYPERGGESQERPNGTTRTRPAFFRRKTDLENGIRFVRPFFVFTTISYWRQIFLRTPIGRILRDNIGVYVRRAAVLPEFRSELDQYKSFFTDPVIYITCKLVRRCVLRVTQRRRAKFPR